MGTKKGRAFFAPASIAGYLPVCFYVFFLTRIIPKKPQPKMNMNAKLYTFTALKPTTDIIKPVINYSCLYGLVKIKIFTFAGIRMENSMGNGQG